MSVREWPLTDKEEAVTEYGSLREKIAAEAVERDAKHAEWAAVIARAHEAGMAAGTGATPTPMVVGSPKNLVGSLMGGDDGGFDPDKPTWYVSEGVCGFAWVAVWAERGGDSRKFANWLSGKTKTKHAPAVEFKKGDRWHGTVYRWVGDFGQSYERKLRYAEAFAEVVREATGFKVYGSGRLD